MGLLAVEDIEGLVDRVVHVPGDVITGWARLSRELNAPPVSAAEASSEPPPSGTAAAAGAHNKTRAGHRAPLRSRPGSACVRQARVPRSSRSLAGEQCGCLAGAAPGQGDPAAAVAVVVDAPGVAELLGLQPHARPPRA